MTAQEPLNRLLKLSRRTLNTLQVNVGKLCNQHCIHCHVDAGPNRKEVMPRRVMDNIASFLEKTPVDKIDITGGAPELNPDFKYLVETLSLFDKMISLRTNLTVMFEPGHNYLAGFYKKHRLELIASLPCYLAQNVDKQRGNGVFIKSIQALNILNELGYGREGTGLILNLVYNPAGPYLPPPQDKLEIDYKRELASHYGIAFNQLYTITNIPINRFKNLLLANGELDHYMELLKSSFNPDVLDKVMCLHQVNIGWDGQLYDCDFNQMLGLGLDSNQPLFIDQVSAQQLIGRGIKVGSHCYGCIAGEGSSCTGSLL